MTPWQWNGSANPWRNHPALVGVPVPESKLPPPWSYREAVGLGLVYQDGAPARRLAVAANPELKKPPQAGWAAGPTPPLVKAKRGPLRAPPEAVDAIYKWLQEQARERLKALKSHLRTGKPSLSEMAFRFNVPARAPGEWVKKARELMDAGKEIVPRAPRRFSPEELQLPRGVIYFSSGTQQSPGEIDGFARQAMKRKGIGVGIDIGKCSEDCMLAVNLHLGKGIPVFVDSGAYGEFTCLLGGAAPDSCLIGDEEWARRLDLYYEIAKRHRSHAYLVAPDKIGDQPETRRRVKKNLKVIKKLSDQGSWILLVAQEGGKKRHVFWEELRKILLRAGVKKEKIVAAIPMKQRATTLKELGEFVRKVDVERFHILGKGPGKVEPALNVIWSRRPGAKITFDSALIRAGGVRGFLGVDPRVYTYAQDLVRYVVQSEAFQKSYRGSGSMEDWVSRKGWSVELVPDYTDSIYGDLCFWLPKQYRRLLADYIGQTVRRLNKQEYKLLEKDPEAFLSSPIHSDDPEGSEWFELPWIQPWLDDQWARYLGAYYSARIKRDAILKAWRFRDLGAIRTIMPSYEGAVEHVMWLEVGEEERPRQLEMWAEGGGWS